MRTQRFKDGRIITLNKLHSRLFFSDNQGLLQTGFTVILNCPKKRSLMDQVLSGHTFEWSIKRTTIGGGSQIEASQFIKRSALIISLLKLLSTRLPHFAHLHH